MLDSYKVLEFPRILNSIAGTCRTEIAKKKILHLEMYDNLADLNEEQNRLEDEIDRLRREIVCLDNEVEIEALNKLVKIDDIKRKMVVEFIHSLDKIVVQ